MRPFFKRRENRRHVFERGPQPEQLKGTTPSRRAWRSFQSRQKRENPIAVADRIQRQARLPSCQTYAQLAAHFGVSRPTICYHLGLLNRLPADFVAWLRACDDPNVLAVMTEHRLRPLTRIADQEQKLTALGELLREAEEEARLRAGTTVPSQN